MKTFKLYFNVLKKHLSEFFLQFAIFILIFFFLLMSLGQEQSETVQLDKVPITVFNEDSNDPLSASLVKSLESSTRTVPLKDEKDILSDAIFFEEVLFVMRIPKGFGESLRQGQEQENPIEVLKALDESSSGILETQINQFVSLYKINAMAEGGNISSGEEENILQKIEQAFTDRITLLYHGTENNRQTLLMTLFFRTLCYYLYVTSISLVGLTMVTMDDKNIQAREISSGYPQIKRSAGMYFSSLLVVFFIWLISLVIGFLFFREAFISTLTARLFILSSFVHMISVASIAIFFGTIAPNKEFISFASTIFALFIGFSSGVFIPKDLIWEPMKNLAYFTPTLWHVELLEELAKTTGPVDWSLFTLPFTVQILMALAFFLLSLAYRRRKQFQGLS